MGRWGDLGVWELTNFSVILGLAYRMKRNTPYHLEIEIDRLTNSVQNTISGDSFATDVFEVNKEDLKTIVKANGWKFNWKAEVKEADKKVYKLTIKDNPDIIQGLASINRWDI